MNSVGQFLNHGANRRISIEDAYLEYENSSGMALKGQKLVSTDGDDLPQPQQLGVSSYVYFSFIYETKAGKPTTLVVGVCQEASR